VARVLELLPLISDGARVMLRILRLLREPNVWIRSRVVLLVGQAKKDPRWLDPFLCDPDARVRSNAVEALWG
jgi:hypothetical protein